MWECDLLIIWRVSILYVWCVGSGRWKIVINILRVEWKS